MINAHLVLKQKEVATNAQLFQMENIIAILLGYAQLKLKVYQLEVLSVLFLAQLLLFLLWLE